MDEVVRLIDSYTSRGRFCGFQKVERLIVSKDAGNLIISIRDRVKYIEKTMRAGMSNITMAGISVAEESAAILG